MSDDFKFDLREFRQAVETVSRDGKKTEEQVLNRAGLVCIIGGKGVKGAIQRTPRADRSKIQSLDPKIIAGIVAKRLRKKGLLSADGKKKVSTLQFAQMVKFERNRRLRSIAYTAGPGWNNAAKAFGGRGVRGVQPGFGNSKAAKGKGIKATAATLVAEMVNTAPAADLIGRDALQDALIDTARDMIAFHEKKMGELLKKHSG